MQTSLCSADFEMLNWTLWTRANHSQSFVTWRHCAWRIICYVKLSGEPTCTAALQNLKNTCYVDCDLFQSRTFRIRDSLQIACLRIAVLFILAWIWFPTVKWSKQKVLTGSKISRGRLALHCWRHEVHWLICCKENTVLWLITETIKHDARNLSWSSRWQYQCTDPQNEVDDKTGKQSNFEKNRFYSFICSNLSPGVCNPALRRFRPAPGAPLL